LCKHAAMKAALLPLLRCPATGRTLELRDNKLVADRRVYPIVDGVPVLIASDRSIFTAENYRPLPESSRSGSGFPRRILHWVDAQLPNLAYDDAGDGSRRARFTSMLREREGRQRVLIVGAGERGVLLDEPDMDVVDTDIFIGANTDIVCDGHDLPFADESFDAVLGIAVLEHVADPPRVVEEMTRVLKSDGLVYSDVPFLQHVHLGAQDFTRYTLLGHRRLFRHFETLLCEPSTGPVSSLAWALDGVLLALCSHNRSSWRLAIRASRLLFGWLAPLDRWLLRTPGAADAACGTVFIGRKLVVPVDDSAVIAEYQGACPTPHMA
jgi:SAM-dependent methyltransferase